MRKLYIAIKIEEDVDFKLVIKKLKELGLKDISEVEENTKSCIYAMGLKSKYLVDLDEYDDEILDEYHKRGL